MRFLSLRFAALGLCVLAAAAPVLAHHSFAAEFDATKPLKVQGRVTRVAWTNPHVWIYFNVAGKDGKAVNWGAEFGAPHQVQTAGLTRTMLQPGEEIVVEGFHARTGEPRMSARRVTSAATGKVFIDTGAAPTN